MQENGPSSAYSSVRSAGSARENGYQLSRKRRACLQKQRKKRSLFCVFFSAICGIRERKRLPILSLKLRGMPGGLCKRTVLFCVFFRAICGICERKRLPTLTETTGVPAETTKETVALLRILQCDLRDPREKTVTNSLSETTGYAWRTMQENGPPSAYSSVRSAGPARNRVYDSFTERRVCLKKQRQETVLFCVFFRAICGICERKRDNQNWSQAPSEL